MGLLDSISDSFNRGAAAAGRATRSAQLKSQMNELLKQRQGLAGQLGASLYEATKDDPTLREGREALYDGIARIDAQRNEIQQQLDAIEAEAGAAVEAATIYVCPDCGSNVYATDMFCTGCGKPVAEIRQLAGAQVSVDASSEDAFCTFCGAPIKSDDLFCMSCGNRIDLTAQVEAEGLAETSSSEVDTAEASTEENVPSDDPENLDL